MTDSSLNPERKIVPLPRLLQHFRRPRAGTLVFTNGCFDLLHAGHVALLAQARALGDSLVVGINSDDSVRRLKGPQRPVNSAEDRAVVLAAMEAVDWVTVFEEDTPRELIRALLPDVLVKGGDYRADEVVGAPEVARAGGETVIVPLLRGRSTTAILNRSTANSCR